MQIARRNCSCQGMRDSLATGILSISQLRSKTVLNFNQFLLEPKPSLICLANSFLESF